MHSTKELYRVPRSYFDRWESKEKVRLAKEHIIDLQKVHYMERDDKLIDELKKAIEHHEFFINED